MVGLLPVPGAPLRRAEVLDDAEKGLEGAQLLLTELFGFHGPIIGAQDFLDKGTLGRLYLALEVLVSVLVRIPAVLFVAALPLFLVTTSVVWAVNDLRLYRYEFHLQGVPGDTDITEDGLLDVARQIRGYFNSRREPLEVRATVAGERRTLFNDREVRHMADVKRLVWGTYGVQWAMALYLVAYAACGLVLRRRPFLHRMALLTIWGSTATVVLVVGVGIAAWVSFDSLFLLFHRLGFANTLWQLDPRHDYLVRIFPESFWFDATFFVGLATVAMAAALALASGVYLWSSRRSEEWRRV